MSIQFGDILQHNNLLYPIVDINDVKGGLRSIATFSSLALVSEYASIPEKYRSGYSLLLETSTGTIYYLAGVDATNVSHWGPVGIGGNGYGVTNTIPKWTSSSILGNSNITDNGDTITINGNLMVIGTTSTVSTENLLIKDPIILLAGSQSTPTYDAGLFVNRGGAITKAFIWDESEKEFKFISTTSLATTSGNVSIDDYENVRTGVLRVGTQSVDANDRFIVSSSGGIVSLIVDENGYVYNRGKGSVSSNTVFGASALSVNTTGYNNTAIGVNTLLSNTVGHGNTALGALALESSTNNANQNTAVGSQALYSNISGSSNTAVGFESLRQNISGLSNTANGYKTLFSNTTGSGNVAFGYHALYSNNADYNTAVGFESLKLNTGFANTAIGYQSLIVNTGGSDNVAIGIITLSENTTGTGNVAIGSSALRISNGDDNVAIGIQCLYFSTTGIFNVGIGSVTLFSNTTGSGNTVIGHNSLALNTIGDFNIAIGYQAGPAIIGATNSSNSIYIGKSAGQNSNGFVNEIVIGSTMSYGNNTVLLGNDSTTKTYLKGSVQLPTMTTTEINLVSGPTDGQVIYNTTLNQICFYNGSSWRAVTDSAM
jgi:hypothetical protein